MNGLRSMSRFAIVYYILLLLDIRSMRKKLLHFANTQRAAGTPIGCSAGRQELPHISTGAQDNDYAESTSAEFEASEGRPRLIFLNYMSICLGTQEVDTLMGFDHAPHFH